MSRYLRASAVCASLSLMGSSLSAQAVKLPVKQLLSSEQSRDSIPKAYRPSAGLCRIWLDGVPPSRQPAPTDCPTAIRNRPERARVIFGSTPDGDGSPRPRTPRDTTKRP